MEVKHAGGGGQGGDGVPLTADQVAHQSKSVIFIKFDGVCWSPECLLGESIWEKGVKSRGKLGLVALRCV